MSNTVIIAVSSPTPCVSINTHANAQFAASTGYVSKHIAHRVATASIHAYVYCGSHEVLYEVSYVPHNIPFLALIQRKQLTLIQRGMASECWEVMQLSQRTMKQINNTHKCLNTYYT